MKKKLLNHLSVIIGRECARRKVQVEAALSVFNSPEIVGEREHAVLGDKRVATIRVSSNKRGIDTES